MAKKAVVIGLDGATFDLLDPLMQEGIMPTLQSLVKTGTRANLKSTMPPYTAPAWTTFATGVNPGKHGCYDFLLPTNDLRNFELCNSTYIQTDTLYELLHEQGKRSILVNLPNTFPAKLDSPTITSLLTVGDNCVFPEDLKIKYPELAEYRLTPDESLQLKGKYDEYIDDIIAVETGHMAAVKQLWQNEPWDFFFYLFSATDWISHAMFDRLVKERPPKAMELFKFIDDQLAWFKAQLPPETNLYVLSDHGFKVFTKTFYFNKWLEEKGYLTTTTAKAEDFHTGITKQDEQRRAIQNKKPVQLNVGKGLMKFLSRYAWLEHSARWFYHAIAKPFLPVKINLDIAIDFEKTKVCFPKGRTMTAIYINDGRKYSTGQPMTDEEYLQLRDQVKRDIENLRGPDGSVVTPRVYTKEEIYGDDTPDLCPDLFYEFGDYWFVGQFHSNELFVDEISNKHDSVGMFVAWGPGIQSGVELTEQNIADLAPTVLHDLGSTVPRYMDGSVMDVFSSAREINYDEHRPLISAAYTARRARKFTEQTTLDSLLDDIDL